MIEIRKGGALRTTWEELRTSIKNNTSSLNIGDEIDIVLKTGEKVTLVCEYVGYKYATFFTKNLHEDTHCMNENWAADNEKCLSTMGSYLSKLFYLLPDDLQKAVAEGPQYIVRRLTPTECARLQGFPDEWGEIGIMSDFSDMDYQFWLDVRDTYATINGKAIKDYTKPQMLTWYNKLHTDSAEYKM